MALIKQQSCKVPRAQRELARFAGRLTYNNPVSFWSGLGSGNIYQNEHDTVVTAVPTPDVGELRRQVLR